MSISKSNKDNPDDCEAIERKTTFEKPNLNGDWLNFYLLIILYMIQGFPIGLSLTLSTILQERKMTNYSEQALFSMSSWPFIFKIVWAPIVDALYVRWIGRRKTWLLPLQLLMGSVLLFMAVNIDDWLPKTGVPNLHMLGLVVFVLNFLSATQDIVVDGWALTMLKKRNVGYSSTCNSVGVPIGMFTSTVCLVTLMSEKFRKTYIQTSASSEGLITMKNFLFFWAIVVFSVTILVAVFKKEKQINKYSKKRINVFQNYKILLEILLLPRMKWLAIALLTARVGFSTSEAVSNLKLIEAGVSNEEIMLIGSVMYAVKFGMPIYISKYISSPKPMSYYFMMTPYKLLWGLVYAAFVYYTQHLTHNTIGELVQPKFYLWTLGCVYLINEMLSLFMTMAMFGFFCRLSDPRFGGTYMTLLNTFYFVGWLIPLTFSLKLVDLLNFSQCSADGQNACSTPELIKTCKSINGSCKVNVDGYYIAMAISTFIGFVWYGIFKKLIKKYQMLSISQWVVIDKEPTSQITEVKEPFIITSASA